MNGLHVRLQGLENLSVCQILKFFKNFHKRGLS